MAGGGAPGGRTGGRAWAAAAAPGPQSPAPRGRAGGRGARSGGAAGRAPGRRRHLRAGPAPLRPAPRRRCPPCGPIPCQNAGRDATPGTSPPGAPHSKLGARSRRQGGEATVGAEMRREEVELRTGSSPAKPASQLTQFKPKPENQGRTVGQANQDCSRNIISPTVISSPT